MKAIFLLKILLCSLVISDAVPVVKVLTTSGSRAEFPCRYEYEARGAIGQMSLQWRGPEHRLLCHYIKHKSFQNCTPGYSLDYTPGKITLIIKEVMAADIGTHVCSVNKQHEFSDFLTELSLRPKSSTEAPTANGNHSGNKGGPLFLFSWALSAFFWG
ncbi:hypothetical protein AAFF_G00134730 [Aldrovandia affinis]|uniref:Ig-like domain-containing protein n=1 Tax=Aldrovandia affinis TaxID=143900 RepID=A0AAD7W9Z2_9TELE|nr:hypothetical protein AAFF_G00134730 [Aldrovandia affinis]